MVMKINKSIPRVMKQKKSVYLAMILLTVLCTFIFAMITQVAQNLYTAKRDYVENNVREDLEFLSTTTIENIETIESNYDLIMEGVLMTEMSFEDKTLRVFEIAEKVNKPAVIEGKLPGSGELAIDPGFARTNDYSVGDTLTIDNQSFKISGIITLPHYAYIIRETGDLLVDSSTFGLAVMTEEDMPKGLYQYAVKYNDVSDDIYEQAKPLKAYLNNNDVHIASWTYAKYNLKISLVDIQVSAMVVISVIYPLIFMLITALLIAVVQGRLIRRESKVIGALLALGYRKKELIHHYLRYPLFIALIGGILGSILGTVAMPFGLNVNLAFFQLPLEKIIYNPLFILLGTVICCIILCLGSLISLNKLFKHSAASLLRAEDKIKKLNFIERKLKLNKFSFKTKFAIREQLRSISRLIFLLVGVIIATMFVMYGFIADSSMTAMLNPPDSRVFHHKVEYATVMPQTQTLKEGEILSAWNMIPRNNMNDSFQLAGILENAKYITLYDKDDQAIKVTDDMVVISSEMASRYFITIGDTIEFVDIINDNEFALTITHITEIKDGDFIFMGHDAFNQLMGWEKNAYNAVMSDKALDVDTTIYKTKDTETMQSDFEEYTMLIKIFAMGFSIAAFFIGVIILYIITYTSIDESKNHISLMKVFGYHSKELSAMILNSSRILVILGFIIGAPAAYMLVKMLFGVMAYINISFPVALNPIYYPIGFAIVIFIYETTKYLTSKKINKVKMVEALKTQE